MLLKNPYADADGMNTLLQIIAESNPKATRVTCMLIASSFVEHLEREGAFDRLVVGSALMLETFIEDLLASGRSLGARSCCRR
jgi:hypothetical protein